MTVALSMPTEIERRWPENFIVTLPGLMEILETEEEEEEDESARIKPTDYAFKTVMKLLLEAGSLMGSNFPKGSACPEKQAYIFHRSSNEHSTEYDVSALNLVNCLKWFNGE